MPLAFSSRSHGTVAFGFFNIATDLLLLEDRFSFCTDLCPAIVQLARHATGGTSSVSLPGWCIQDAARLGNLHGAIAGTDHSGLIGATYDLWPFPREVGAFRQDPDGTGTRSQVEALLETHGRPLDLQPTLVLPGGLTTLGGIEFSAAAFGQLLGYLAAGGMPGWREGRVASCVARMLRDLERLEHPWPLATHSDPDAAP